MPYRAADASALVERTTGLDPVISDMASRRSSSLSYVRVDPGRGLEPRFAASKAALLPLETSPESTSWFGAKDSNPPLLGQSQPCYLTTPAPSELNWRPRRESNSPAPARQAGVHASGPRGHATVHCIAYSVDKVL